MHEDVTDARMQIQVVEAGVDVTGDARISRWQAGGARLHGDGSQVRTGPVVNEKAGSFHYNPQYFGGRNGRELHICAYLPAVAQDRRTTAGTFPAEALPMVMIRTKR